MSSWTLSFCIYMSASWTVSDTLCRVCLLPASATALPVFMIENMWYEMDICCINFFRIGMNPLFVRINQKYGRVCVFFNSIFMTPLFVGHARKTNSSFSHNLIFLFFESKTIFWGGCLNPCLIVLFSAVQIMWRSVVYEIKSLALPK